MGNAGESTRLTAIANTIHRWAELRATRRNLILSGVLWLVSAAGVVALQARVATLTGGRPVPDVVPFYTPQQLSTLIDQYGEVGRRAFLQFTLYDALYPFAAYGFALLLLASLLRPLARVRASWAYFVLLPLVAISVELLEQFGFLLTLLFFPLGSQALGWSLAALSAAKLILLGGLTVLLLLLASARVVMRLRRPTTQWS